MEKKLIDGLAHLSIEATERLLDETVEMQLSGRQRRRIKASALEKAGLKEKQGFYIPKKSAILIAVIAAAILLPLTVAAANKLFTFIPGVAITEKIDETIYAMEPVVRQISAENAKANLVSAVYADGYLSATVEVLGKAVYSDGFAIYANQRPLKLEDELFNENGYDLAVSSDSTMMSFSYPTEAPDSNDIYEVAVTGFAQRLSFKMTPCRDYDDLREIGPTEMQNGISITATAQRFDDQLTVWCYPFRTADAAKDMILGFGEPSNSSFYKMRYIESENGQGFTTTAGWQLRNRLVFDMPENDQSAILHVPYLAMLRGEKKKLRVNLPEDYGTAASDIAVECSLGTIRVTQIERKPNEYEQDKDTVMIKLAFDSNDSNQALYSFNYQVAGRVYTPSAIHCNAETGCTEYLEVYVEKNTTKISLNVLSLYYYLFGEYVIPLEMR